MSIKNYLCLFIIIIIGISCRNPIKKEVSISNIFKIKNESKSIVFSLDTIFSFGYFNSKNCIPFDSISSKKFFLERNNLKIPLNIRNLVTCSAPIFCPKIKNLLITGYNSDSLFFSHNFDTLKISKLNFKKALKKQFFNNRKNPNYADSPYSNLVWISFKTEDNQLLDKEIILQKIDTISYSYFEIIKNFNKANIDSLKNKYPLNIILMEEIEFILDSIPPPSLNLRKITDE